MKAKRKITVKVPEKLLKKAQLITGCGVTSTVVQALELIILHDAYEKLAQMRGKVNINLDLKELREDRPLNS